MVNTQESTLTKRETNGSIDDQNKMNKTDSDKLAAIHRSAEINKLEIENMIDIFEKKMSIVENKLIEYECRYELTERQEDMMYKLQEQLNEMQDSIDSIEEVRNALEDLISATVSFV